MKDVPGLASLILERKNKLELAPKPAKVSEEQDARGCRACRM
jgi:hypothetical protein